MARICRRVVRRKYYGKSTYEYVTLWLYLPKRFHHILEPLINMKLDIKIRKGNGKLQIILSPER